METAWILGLLVNLPSFCILACVIGASTIFVRWLFQGVCPIPIKRLLPGYLVALTTVAILCVAAEITVAVGHGRPVVVMDGVVLIVIFGYFTCLGIALIGAPLVFSMTYRGYGTIPRVMLAEVVISLLVLTLPLALVTYKPRSDGIFIFIVMLGLHVAQAMGFGIGLGLPWSWQRVVPPPAHHQAAA